MPPRRRYDAASSRRALLDAAAALFHERGYRGATVREIGERADVDPAMIARYYGGKEGLYLAALADERYAPPSKVGSGDLIELARTMLEQWDELGPTPGMRTLLSATPTDEVRDQIRAIFDSSILDQLTERLRERGLADPRRRAELLVGALAGVLMVRQNGILPTIRDASAAELLELIAPMVDALQQPS
jgi:AcrR family transcriptional regulator